MHVRFEWGTPDQRGREEWDVEQIPRKGEYVELENHNGYVRDVLWVLSVNETPRQQAVIRLS